MLGISGVTEELLFGTMPALLGTLIVLLLLSGAVAGAIASCVIEEEGTLSLTLLDGFVGF